MYSKVHPLYIYRCLLFLRLFSHIGHYRVLSRVLYATQLCHAVLSHVRLSATPWTAKAPLSTEFSRQEYWSGLPCPPPGDLPNPGIKPRSPTLQQILYQLNHQGNPYKEIKYTKKSSDLRSCLDLDYNISLLSPSLMKASHIFFNFQKCYHRMYP